MTMERYRGWDDSVCLFVPNDRICLSSFEIIKWLARESERNDFRLLPFGLGDLGGCPCSATERTVRSGGSGIFRGYIGVVSIVLTENAVRTRLWSIACI